MTYWHRGDIASIESAERAVILLLARDLTSQPFVLEAQAARIWQALSVEPREESSIVTHVADHYGLAPGLIRDDVIHFLVELETRGLAISSQLDCRDSL